MNISDLVPLIIIIGSIVYSIVKNTGKAKQEEMAKTTLPGKKEIKLPPEIVYEFPAEKDIVAKESGVKEKRKKENPEITPHSVRISHSRQMSGLRSVIAEDDELPYTVFNAENAADNTDELKKAIIYSEIINRKEF